MASGPFPGLTNPSGESGDQCAPELRSTHDRLRGVIESLRSDRERRQGPDAHLDPLPIAVPQAIEGDPRELGRELAAARLELADRCAEAERLRDRLTGFASAHRRIHDEHVLLEEQYSELGRLHVTLERLHGTLERREVLTAVQEIVINVIGSEELAVFELTEGGGELHPVHCFGVEARQLGPVPLGSGPIGRAAAERRAWVSGDGPPSPEAPDLMACIPLQAAGRVIGVLAFWHMVEHKHLLGPVDRKVLSLIARHAGAALYLTSLHERRQAEGL